MKHFTRYLFLLLTFPTVLFAHIQVGIGKADMTPSIGTPSAGYGERKGEGMEGAHDSLLATALFIDNGTQQIILCSVDHLGFTFDMVQAITQKVKADSKLQKCEIYIGSSHTHSGGGAYLNIPIVGPSLAGIYDPQMTQFYIDQTVKAIFEAYKQQSPAKIGIGYGHADALTKYRGKWPTDILPLDDVMILKITHLDDTPLAVFFNYPVHPTLLKSQNRLFSADLIGYTRNHLQTSLGSDVLAIYFNGAQGDIIPVVLNENDRFDACDQFGKALAHTVKNIWDETRVDEDFDIETRKKAYSFKPEKTPFGLTLPIENYQTEMNVLIFNQTHAVVTIPGELSCLYDKRLKEIGKALGYSHVSIFGLTNDAHGYIILPESWQHKSFESGLSFGGENYGDLIEKKAEKLLKELSPQPISK